MDMNYKEETARLREKCERMGREREKKAVILTTHEPSFYSYWSNRVCLKVDPNDMFDMWVQCKAARRMRIDVEVDFNPVGFYEVTYVVSAHSRKTLLTPSKSTLFANIWYNRGARKIVFSLKNLALQRMIPCIRKSVITSSHSQISTSL